ncbi:McrC family protein [Saccharibacillus kuerlensis]|uniref:McrBC 5-methylcytosine restriction system component family protein n=1 Tax=Saccharibacillus kuerlensis TaxID=459527 RepID=A0ABQ2L099_9BACL|nr:McrC family protein [Saccharibacillus kuerlensis]GGN98510.1 mcrBC 5-methylcytosine restriction system component family protein [Saccharibacillus kuerlensis]
MSTYSDKKSYRVTLKEFGTLCKHPSGETYGYTRIPENVFDRLEQFILEHRTGGGESEALELLTLSSRRGAGRLINAKSYVGVIVLADGSQIEILPKLYVRDEEGSEAQTKRTFLHMLRTIGEIPSKAFGKVGLGTDKSSILDIFIRMFIEEAHILVKRGLKSDYREREGNERFYRGKLQVAQHIRHNAFHRERFYIRYDEFSVDRPENRLIKATLEKLIRITRGSGVRKDLYTLLNAFEGIPASADVAQDWSRVSSDRSMQEYKTLLAWCRVFLDDRSFTPFGGSDQVYALLFPMEKVFERYVAVLLQRKLTPEGVEVSTQDLSHKLFQTPARFQLRPDIVLRSLSGVIVMDTKWKLLDGRRPDYGISQGDMYQAYAYGKKYGAEKVYLIYPQSSAFMADQNRRITYDSGDGVTVEVVMLDLGLRQECVEELVQLVRELSGAADGYRAGN